MDSTLFFNPFPVVYMNFATKNLLVCLCSASSTVETISMTFPYLVNFYLQIQNPINLIYMPTTYLESFGADLSENELFQCVSILLTGTSTPLNLFGICWDLLEESTYQGSILYISCNDGIAQAG